MAATSIAGLAAVGSVATALIAPDSAAVGVVLVAVLGAVFGISLVGLAQAASENKLARLSIKMNLKTKFFIVNNLQRHIVNKRTHNNIDNTFAKYVLQRKYYLLKITNII